MTSHQPNQQHDARLTPREKKFLISLGVLVAGLLLWSFNSGAASLMVNQLAILCISLLNCALRRPMSRLSIRRRCFLALVYLLLVTPFCVSQYSWWRGWTEYEAAGGCYAQSSGKSFNEQDPGRWQKMSVAAALFTRSWFWNPLFFDGAVQAGDAHYQLQDLNQAIRYYNLALKVNPRAFYAHYGKAKCYKDLQQYGAMAESLKAAQRIHSPLNAFVVFSEDFVQLKGDKHLGAFLSEFQ